MEPTLIELRWSTFQSSAWLNGDRIFEAWFWAKAEQKEESSRTGQQKEGLEAEREEEGSKAEWEKESSPTEGRPPLRIMTSWSEAIKRCPKRASYFSVPLFFPSPPSFFFFFFFFLLFFLFFSFFFLFFFNDSIVFATCG